VKLLTCTPVSPVIDKHSK